ncbi:MAG: hypothetical protein U0441_12030 [Polyangiaceae bacterium]
MSLRTRAFRSLGLVSFLVALGACTPEKPATAPDGTPTAKPDATAKAHAPKGPDAYAAAGPFAEETFPTVDTAPLAAGALPYPFPGDRGGVGPAAAVCTEYLSNKPVAPPACGDAKSALEALDQALQVVNADLPATQQMLSKTRDAKLAGLEACAGIPTGLVRALRIELAPAGCGDVLAEPMLKAPPKDLRGDVHEALYGLALAAKLSRASVGQPKLDPPYTKARVEKFTSDALLKWMKSSATTIQGLSGDAVKLHFYGGAVAAVASGVADLGLVDAVRSAPIPDEYEKDEERKNIYYSRLDEMLEPRKNRGRDAALVGLTRFSEVGSVADGRVQEARRLLSKLYGGRRIDALDRLLFPQAPAATGSTLEERLAVSLPTFYFGILVDAAAAKQPGVLKALATRGVPMPHRKALHEGALSPEAAEMEAWAHLALGRTYWRATDFDEAARALTQSPPAERTPANKLLAALAMGLRGGPKDAAEMMLKLPFGMNAHGQRAALDKLAAESTPLSGAAAFDAAYLMEITAPEKADGIFFKSLAKRYTAAADLLTDATEKTEAQARAKAAEAIAPHVN